jgi:transposase InsO family protein
MAKRRRRRLQIVQWLVRGAVWAVDGTWLAQPVAGAGRRALVVVELHSRKTLAVASVPGERAVAAEHVLEALFTEHGAPLVLKLDNGSAFTARRFADFCERNGVALMHSPVRRPSWNGTCEVSGRWAKRRAEAAARQRGAPGVLTHADLDAAISFIGTMPRIVDALRRRFQDVLAQMRADVARERGLVLAPCLPDSVNRSLGRVAARRALQLCHILSIHGREFRQCFPVPAA